MDAASTDKRIPGQWLMERFGGKPRPSPGPTTLDSDTTLYMYVRNSVTSPNASLDPVPVQKGDTHFRRLILARDHGGKPIIRLNPRGIFWFFGASNLPYGQYSISFGNRAYFAWDYDPVDPIVTRAMAYEVTRVLQQKRLGGELAFAKTTCSESYCDLLDQSTGHTSRRQRERQYVAISWWQFSGRRRSTASTETATCPSPDKHEDSVSWPPAS